MPATRKARCTTTSAPAKASSSTARSRTSPRRYSIFDQPWVGRVERTPGDADDPADPVVGLEPGQEAEAERPRRTGDRDRQRRVVRPARARALGSAVGLAVALAGLGLGLRAGGLGRGLAFPFRPGGGTAPEAAAALDVRLPRRGADGSGPDPMGGR